MSSWFGFCVDVALATVGGLPRAAVVAARVKGVWCGYRRGRFMRAGWRIRAAQGIGPGAGRPVPRQPRRPGACAHGQERWCGWVCMVAASRGPHRTAADDGLEKPAIGESVKMPRWCLSGTRALPRKNPAHRASPGNSPEKKSQEDGRDTACTPPRWRKVIITILLATGRAEIRRMQTGCAARERNRAAVARLRK